MKAFSEDGLDLAKLKDGVHTWTFNLDGKFFSFFEQSSLKEGQLKVDVYLRKVEHVFQVNLDVEGSIEAPCDNCLEEIPLSIQESLSFVIKLTDQPKEDDEEREVYYLPGNEAKLYLAKHIYDLVYLGLPIKKTCDNPGSSKYCNTKLLDKMDDINEGNENDEGTDPRWDKLKDLL